MNRVSRHTFVALLLVLGVAGTAFSQHSVTAWPDGKAAAVSLTFDDAYPSQLTLVVPVLDSYGVKGTFFLVTNTVTSIGQWDNWRAVAAEGHEIGSHTLSHLDLTSVSADTLDAEVGQSKATIDAQIPGQTCISFAYPYGAFNPSVQGAAGKYYLAARGVTWGTNLNFYINWWGLQARGDDPGSTLSDMIAHTDQAVSAGAWFITYMHDLSGQYYGVWTPAMLTGYLDALMTRNVWVGPMGSVVKYVKERDSATLSLVSSTPDQIVLDLQDTLDDATYNQPLTIRSEVPANWSAVGVQQGTISVQVLTGVEGGARVVYYHAVPGGGSITLTPLTAPALTGVSLAPASVVGGTSSTGTVTLAGPAIIGGAVVSLGSSSTSVATVPASVTVPAGSASATFAVSTATQTATATSTITAAYNGTNQAATLTVTPLTLTSVSVSPTSVTGGTSSTGTVTLNATAPTGGVVVTLTSSTTAAATVPASVTVPAGASGVLFAVTTTAGPATVTSTITATCNGTSQTATLTVISTAPPVITTSALAAGTVGVAYSQALAATGGITPYTWSATGVPGGLSLSTAGALSGTPTASGTFTLTITVTDAAAKKATTSLSLTVATAPPPPTSIAIDVTAFGDGDGSGSSSVTTSTLTTTAANELLVAFLGSADGAAAGASVSGLGLTWTKAVAKAGNGDTEIWWAYATGTVSGTVTAAVTLNYSRSLTVVAFKGTAAGADAIGATAGVARTGAPTASLVTTRANSWVFGVGNEYWGALNVTVGSGQTLVRQYLSTGTGDTYWVQRRTSVTPAAGTTVTINATAPTGVGNLSLVEIRPAGQAASLSGVSVNPTSVAGGSSATGTVTLSSAAPTGGAVVGLTSTNTAAATVPASVTVQAGGTSATFTVSTIAGTATAASTITATYGGASQSATLTVTVPPTTVTVTDVSLHPTTVVAGSPSTGTVTIGSAAPTGGVVVTLKSSSTSVATVPTSVTVPAGSTSATFTVSTSKRTTTATATITATCNGASQTDTLTVTPLALTGLSLSPTSVKGGTTSAGTVTLTGAAPSGGVVVTLRSSSTLVATVPTSVTVPAGSRSATFTVSTRTRTSTATATITATYSGTSKKATLTVTR